MLERLIAALIVIGLALCGLWAAENWGDDQHELLVDASAVVIVPPEGGDPLAFPHEDMLVTPCPLSPSNVPLIQRRTA